MQSHPSLGDILANAITHGVGAVLAVAGAVYLVIASRRGNATPSANDTPKATAAPSRR